MNKEWTNTETVFKLEMVADGQTETIGANTLKPEDDTEIMITNAKEDERMLEATEGNNNDDDGDDGDISISPVKRLKRNMPRPSQRQVQISYHQGRSYLSPAELRKLDNLMEQEEV